MLLVACGDDNGGNNDTAAGLGTDSGIADSGSGTSGTLVVCEPGKVISCPCTRGGQGAQRCADDGARWNDCECAIATASDADTDAHTNTNTSTDADFDSATDIDTDTDSDTDTNTGAYVMIDFDDLTGAVELTDQYLPHASLSSSSGTTVRVEANGWANSSPDFMYADNFYADVYIDFPSPVRGIVFPGVAIDNSSGVIAVMKLYHSDDSVDTVELIASEPKTETYDLSSHSDVIRMEITETSDAWGTAWDDLSFVVE